MDGRAGLALFACFLLAGCAGNEGQASPEGPEDAGDGPGPTDQPDPEEGPSEASAAGPVEGERVSVLWMNGTYEAYAGGPWGAGTSSGDLPHEELPIDGNTTQVALTLSWTSPGGTQDLDPALTFPGCWRDPAGGCWRHAAVWLLDEGWAVNDGGGPGSPDSPATLVVAADVLRDNAGCNMNGFCDWMALVHTHAPLTAAVDYSLRVEIRSSAP